MPPPALTPGPHAVPLGLGGSSTFLSSCADDPRSEADWLASEGNWEGPDGGDGAEWGEPAREEGEGSFGGDVEDEVEADDAASEASEDNGILILPEDGPDEGEYAAEEAPEEEETEDNGSLEAEDEPREEVSEEDVPEEDEGPAHGAPAERMEQPPDPLAALAFAARKDSFESVEDVPPTSSPARGADMPFKTPINYKASLARRSPARAFHTPATSRAPAPEPSDALLEAAIAASSPVKALLQLSTPRYHSSARRSPRRAGEVPAFPLPTSSAASMPSPSAADPTVVQRPRPVSTATLVGTPAPRSGPVPAPIAPPSSTPRDDGKVTYVTMIGSAILNHPNRCAPLSYILSWMRAAAPARFADGPWANSVRHNLSIQDCFVKVPPAGPPADHAGPDLSSPDGFLSPTFGGSGPRSKGNCWAVRPDFLDAFRPPGPDADAAHPLWHFERGRKHGSARTSRRRSGKHKHAGNEPDVLSPGGPPSDLLSPPAGADLLSPLDPPRLVIRLPAPPEARPQGSGHFSAEGARIGNPFAGPEGRALLQGARPPKRKGENAEGGKGKVQRTVPLLVAPVPRRALGESDSPNKARAPWA